MSLNYQVDVFPGSPAQVNVGILGKAKVTLMIDNDPIVSLEDIYIRRGKNVAAWVNWASRQDPKGKTDEQGRIINYPIYKLFPTDLERRKKVEATILERYNKVAAEGSGTKVPTNVEKRAPQPQAKPKAAAPPPAPVQTETEDLNFAI